MKGTLVAGLVVLAATAVIVECLPRVARDASTQDVGKVMPAILAAMIRYGPNTQNPNLNTFIKIITEADAVAAKSSTSQINTEQFADFGRRGLDALCAATSTTPARQKILQDILEQGMKTTPNQNMDILVRMISQTVVYLGDDSAESQAKVIKMFMDFLTMAPDTGKSGSGPKSFAFDKSKLVSKTPAAKPTSKPGAKPGAKPAKTGAKPAKQGR